MRAGCMSGLMVFGAALMCAVAAHAQTQTRVTIVALGASNTEGWSVFASEAYPAKLQALLNARGIEAAVINAGIAGDTTGGMLARLERAVPAGTHVVILQPGTNDERMGLGAERAGNPGYGV
jgi:acyl-CoA thioesterase-1